MTNLTHYVGLTNNGELIVSPASGGGWAFPNSPDGLDEAADFLAVAIMETGVEDIIDAVENPNIDLDALLKAVETKLEAAGALED